MSASCTSGPASGRHRAGSAAAFAEDWRAAGLTDAERWLVYPDLASSRYLPVIEAIKAEQVLRLLDQNGINGGRVLEYGCGAAGMSVFLRNRGFDAVALDRSLDALALARRNDARHGTAGAPIRLCAGDVLALPFPEGAFDVVMSYGLLEHFDASSVRVLLAAVTRMLRPGGVFVADIVPGGVNVRTAAALVSFLASAAVHVARGGAARVAALRRAYFGHYYENAFRPERWEQLLAAQGLNGIRVDVVRPFPPLALSGTPERLYVALMRRLLPVWYSFDSAQTPLTRAWGWTYLAVGVKPRGALPAAPVT